jgi:lysophospholipase L1-like esterase
LTTPLPPHVNGDVLRIANVYMPANASSVKPQQVYVIGDGVVEPDDEQTMIRCGLVSKTLRKLRGGQPVTIVAWGDSVTAGGEASRPELAFPQLFVTKLKERFQNASINLVNAGIGATNTTMRLPGIAKDVIAQGPDLVLIEFVNDMPLPEATLRSNLQSAFDQIRVAGAEIVLITPHWVMPEMMGHDAAMAGPRAKETRKNVDVLRAIATEQSVALADVSRRWEHLAKEGLPYVTLLRNGINHPDDRGHELFVKELLTFFPVEQQ